MRGLPLAFLCLPVAFPLLWIVFITFAHDRQRACAFLKKLRKKEV